MSFLSPTKSNFSPNNSVINSPFIMAREYKEHVDKLESENFTLRMLLNNNNFIETKLSPLLISHNIPEDVQSLLIQQEFQLDNANKEIERLQRELFEHTNHNDNDTEDVLEASALNVQIEKLQGKVDELENKNKDNLDIIDKLTKELEPLKDKIQQLQTEKDKLEQENKNQNEILNGQISELKNQLENVKGDVENFRDRANDLENELENTKNDLLEEQDKNKKLEGNIEYLEKQLEEKENEDTIFNFSSLENTVKNLEKATSECDELQRENKLLQDNNNDLVEKNVQLNQAIDDLNQAINDLKQQKLDLENELESILGEFEVEDSGDLMTKYESLVQINNELRDQLEEITKENENLRNENEELNNKLNEYKNENNNNNIDDTFDVSGIEYNSTFGGGDDGVGNVSFNMKNSSPKRLVPMSAQKKIDQLMGENNQLKVRIEEMNIQLSRYIKAHSIAQTSPIKQNFAVSNASGFQSKYPQSPEKSLLSDLQTRIKELSDQNAALKQENVDLHDQIHSHGNSYEELLPSENSINFNNSRNNASHISQGSSSSTRNNTLNNLSTSSIINPSEKRLRAENEQLRQNLENAKKANSMSMHNKSEIEKLNREISKLKKENEDLKNDEMNLNTLRLKMQLVESNRRINQLESAQYKIKNSTQKRVVKFLSKINSFADKVDKITKLTISKTQKICHDQIPQILLQKTHYPLTNLRNDVVKFIEATSGMMCDLRDGATACIRATANMKNLNHITVPFTVPERKQLLLLKRRYSSKGRFSADEDDEIKPEMFAPYSPIGKTKKGNFNRAINDYNNNNNNNNNKFIKNMPNTSGSGKNRNSGSSFDSFNQTAEFLSQKEYKLIVNQIQLLINTIWKLFGESNNDNHTKIKAPNISELIKHSKQFKELIQQIIQMVSQKFQIFDIINVDHDNQCLSPVVVNLLKSVRDQVQYYSQIMHNDHKDLLNFRERADDIDMSD